MSEEREFTILDDPNLIIYATKLEQGQKKPSFRLSGYENNPRLVVRTGWDGDRNKGLIEARFNTRNFYNFLEMIEIVANSKEPMSLSIENHDHLFIDGKRSPEPKPASLGRVEKLADGRIVLFITAGKNRPVIEFDFANNENGQGRIYHFFKDGDGNPMQPALASKIAARAWIKMARDYWVAYQAKAAKQPKWMAERDQRNSQGGNNYQGGGQRNNNYGGNGGGQQQQRPQQSSSPTVDFDDDTFM